MRILEALGLKSNRRDTIAAEIETTSGATSCITLTPRLPSPPLIPSALPCFALGKKKLMLPMLEAKLAPAKPQSRAITIKIQ